MQKLFAKFNEKSFRLTSMAFFFLGDLSICYYIYVHFMELVNSAQFKEWMEVYYQAVSSAMAQQGGALDPGMMNELSQIFYKSLITSLLLVIGFHLIVYLLYHLNKKGVFWYLKSVAWLGLVACLWVGLFSSMSHWIRYFLILQAALYFFNAWGLRYFPFQPKKIPGR
jgi:hypothetical protein